MHNYAEELLNAQIAAHRERIAGYPSTLAEEQLPQPMLECQPVPLEIITQLTDAQLAPYIDHTLLAPDADAVRIESVCREALEFGCAAICVHPCRVEQCRAVLAGTPVMLASVVGFPTGATTMISKAAEAVDVVRQGAREVDMVINIGWLKDGQDAAIVQEIRVITEVAAPARIKVIIETGLLTADEKIRACLLARAAGAHYVKTSTGLQKGGATEEDVRLMRQVVGNSMGVKASGGIRDAAAARAMLAAGASRLGCSSTAAIVGRG